MKKFLALILALVMSLSLVACGGSKEETKPTEEKPTETEQPAEAAGLYCTAAYTGKRALTILSISDSLVTGEELPPADRQSTFTQMMEIALETAVEMAKE